MPSGFQETPTYAMIEQPRVLPATKFCYVAALSAVHAKLDLGAVMIGAKGRHILLWCDRLTYFRFCASDAEMNINPAAVGSSYPVAAGYNAALATGACFVLPPLQWIEGVVSDVQPWLYAITPGALAGEYLRLAIAAP